MGNFGADGHECNENSDGANSTVVITHILFRDKITNIEVKQVGYGQIAARFLEKDEVPNFISRIWCEWLGKRIASNGLLKVPDKKDPTINQCFKFPIPESKWFKAHKAHKKPFQIKSYFFLSLMKPKHPNVIETALPRHDDPLLVISMRSEGIARSLLVIWHLVNHVALPFDASGLRNTD
ncbi:hypothetical protein ACFX19_003325 [Malus domestica]